MASLVSAGIEHARRDGLRSLARSAARLGVSRATAHPRLHRVGCALSERALRQRQRHEHGLEDILDTAYQFQGYGRYASIAPAQVRPEIRGLAGRAHEHDPDTVLEIGSMRGGTLYTWARHLDADTIVSLDLPGGDFGGDHAVAAPRLFERFDPGTDIECIRDNSHHEHVPDRVRRAFNDEPVDFLFIDGDHTYDGVKADFEMYAPLVRDGGLVAFHDIVEHDDNPECEVDVFWREVRQEYPAEEIVDTADQGWGGVGVIEV